MQSHSVRIVLLAASAVVLTETLGLQKSLQRVTANVGESGLLRREGHDVLYNSVLAPHSLEQHEALEQRYFWPSRDWTPLKSSLGRTSDEHTVANMFQENVPTGVVCPTWLNQEIQDENLKPFLNSTGVHPEGFVAELSRLCGADEALFVKASATNYSGSWDDEAASPNDVRVLKGLAQWQTDEKKAGRSKQWTWEQFSKPDNGTGMASFVKYLMSHPTNISVSGPSRVLDFGCGSGTDVLAMKAALNSTSKDTLCLDVFPIDRTDVTPMLLDATSPAKYHDSLEKALVGNENSVDVAVSMVAFHHIPNPQMRSDALVFLRKVLKPGGIFIMAEWDNSIQPNRWIHYDLVHILPNMLFSGDAPADEKELEIGTNYLSVENWITTAEKAGLKADSPRSGAYGHTPEEQAASPGNANRDFHLVFTK